MAKDIRVEKAVQNSSLLDISENTLAAGSCFPAVFCDGVGYTLKQKK